MDNRRNKVALVTGASSGVGKASAQALLQAGFDVVLAARRRELLDRAVQEANGAPGKALAVSADVRDEKSVAELFRRAVEAFGRVDVLFNNAGVSIPETPIEEYAVEQWQSAIDVNLTGSFLCAREAVRVMKRQNPKGGRIINNGSVSAQAPRPGAIAYNATKTAITGLTRSLALDGRKYDIACGQIDIGNAATDMSSRMTAGVRQADGSVKPEPRFDVREVARTIVYMASLPPDVNIFHITIMATQMPLVGRG